MEVQKVGFFQSVKFKIMALSVVAIIICTVFFLIVGMAKMTEQDEESATQIMNLTCQNETAQLNTLFGKIESSMDIMLDYVSKNVPSEEEQAANPAALQEFMEDVEYHYDSIAGITDGIVAYYYTYKPGEMVEGVFKIDMQGNGEFEEFALTDITQYTEEEKSHVSWYYDVLKAGEPIWFEPYMNENYNKYIISYEVPIKDEDGNMYAVIGMDIDFTVLEELIDEVSVYDSGYAFLTNREGKIFYHKDLEEGTYITDVDKNLDDFVKKLNVNDSWGMLYGYKYKGVEKKMAFCSLDNGMKFVIVAPLSEIEASKLVVQKSYLQISIVVILIIILITIFMSDRVTKPLVSLTGVAREIGNGKLNVEFPKKTGDEIGVLNITMQGMVVNIKKIMDKLHDNAYKDGMTGLGNKRAYEEVCKSINNPDYKFGMIMFDVNFLKKVNDECGHDKGDMYLKTASNLIAEVFEKYACFRFGGDEFAVVLLEEQIYDGKALLRKFDDKAEIINSEAKNLWERIEIAKGMAIYDPDEDGKVADPVDVTIKLADARMYKDKAEKKRV